MTRTLALASSRSTRRASSSPLAAARLADPELRRIVVRVRQWGLEQGRTCSTDALTVVAGVAVEEARTGETSPLCWTEARVAELLNVGATVFCLTHQAALPMGLSPAMLLWLDYLDAQDAFSAGSQPAPRLRAVVTRRPRAMGRARRLAPRHPAGTRG